jgi:hypothetical protein
MNHGSTKMRRGGSLNLGMLTTPEEDKGNKAMAKKKMSDAAWEHSQQDFSQDKKLAKKYGMSMSEWEKSDKDVKHDMQQSPKGLRGGGIATRGMGAAYKEGGSVCMAGGGMVTPVGTGMARSKSCKVS